MHTPELVAHFYKQISELRNDMHVQIHSLRNEMHVQIHSLKDEMNKRFSSLETRVTAIETKLGMVNESQREVRNKLIEYSFRTGWILLGAATSYVFLQLHNLVK